MKITIESTTKVTDIIIEGVPVPARLWEGHTDSGIPVHCFITRLSPTIPKDDARQEVFVSELREQRAPTVPGIPLRMIL